MGFNFPDFPQKFDALRDALIWASGCDIFWINQNDGGIVREENKVWGELKPLRISSVGVDEKRNEETDDATNPRREIICGNRIIQFQLNMRSRNQEHRYTGWYAAEEARTKLRSDFALNRFFKPFDLGIATISDILDVPETFDDRLEDIAILEINLNTSLNITDAAMVGTWIESIEATSNLIPLGASLQLNDEVMP